MEHRLPADAKMTFFRWSSFDARDGSQRARFNSPEYALHDLISKRFAAHHSPRTTRTEIHAPAMYARSAAAAAVPDAHRVSAGNGRREAQKESSDAELVCDTSGQQQNEQMDGRWIADGWPRGTRGRGMECAAHRWRASC